MNGTNILERKNGKIKNPINEGLNLPKSRTQLSPTKAPDILPNPQKSIPGSKEKKTK